MKQHFTANEEVTLLSFLSATLAGVPRERIKIQLKRGEVRVNGKKTLANIQLHAGDTVEIFLPSKFDLPMPTVVYEDEMIMLVDKPPFVESERQLPAWIESKTGKHVTAAHRLDTNTTGIIILAKTESAMSALIEGFRNNGVCKTYIAQVFGCPQQNSDRLTAYLFKHADDGFCSVYPEMRDGCKEIITEYEVIDRGEISRLYLRPVTGRTHQLRAHMAFIACPIVGDDKYGDVERNRNAGVKRQRLRAVSVRFCALPAPLSYLNGKEFSVPEQQEAGDKE